MVIFVGLLDLFGKKDVGGELTGRVPYALRLSLHPLRLTANRSDSVRLTVRVENRTREPLLTSIVVQVPKQLGLDQTCLSSVREIRLGELPAGEAKDVPVDVFGSTKTDSGEYNVIVTAIAHYRNYAQTLNSEKKAASIRVV